MPFRHRLVLAACITTATTTLLASCATMPTNDSADYVIRNVNIVDTRTGNVLRNRSILIEEGVISRIVADAPARPGPSATVIDGAGAYAIPGLWDAHLHILSGGADEAIRQGRVAVSYGVTHGRDMGSAPEALSAYAHADDTGAPRVSLIAAGPAFWAIELPYGDKRQQTIVETEAQIEAGVAAAAAAGSAFIKVYAGFSQESLEQLVEAASRHGLRVSGHAQPGMSLDVQAETGLLTVEHADFATFQGCGADPDAFFNRVIAARFAGSRERIPDIYAEFSRSLDPGPCGEILRRAARAGIVMTPTLSAVFLPEAEARRVAHLIGPAQREICDLYLRQFDGLDGAGAARFAQAGRTLVGLVRQAGVPILAGTDAPTFCSVVGAGLPVELALLYEAGLTPLEVLQSATLTPARVFGFERRFGELRPGFDADILLLRENPLDTVSAFSRPTGLFTQGRWLDSRALGRLRGD